MDSYNLENLAKNFERRKFIPHLCKNLSEAKELVLELIPKGKSVGFGGSMTIVDGGIHTLLKDGERIVYHTALSPASESKNFPRGTDWYLSSSNAVTQSGELVNIDGRCNRVAGLLGEPQNICVIIGKNKIVDNIEAAIERIKKVASPPNARRLGRNLPCAKNACPGECHCVEKMCCATVILHNPPIGKNFHIIIVDEILGY